MTPPPWPARRVGDRIVCGRQVARQYVCQGELARVERGIAGGEYFASDVRLVEDPAGSGSFRPVAGDRRGRHETMPVTMTGPRFDNRGRIGPGAAASPAGPGDMQWRRAWTRRCPHCTVLAIVEALD